MTLAGLLTDITWLGPLFVAPFFIPVEAIFPRVPGTAERTKRARTLLAVGATTIIVTYSFSLIAENRLIELSYAFRVIDIAALPWPRWLIYLISFLILDLNRYILHVISHKVPILWRLHRVHHSDDHVTACTGVLHHPLEGIVGLTVFLSANVILGIPIIAILLYGAGDAIQSVIAHANIRYPKCVNRCLRFVVATPDIHRTHHSTDMKEGNSNFGQVFMLWDHLFGTFADKSNDEIEGLRMGTPGPQMGYAFRFGSLLASPFKANAR